MAVLHERLAPVLGDLARTCQGRVVTEADADEFFLQLRGEFVARMMIEMEPWGEDEDLREPVVDLLLRHLLADAREGLVRRVVGASRSWERRIMRFVLALLGLALAVGVPLPAGAAQQAGVFRGEGAEFAVKYYAGGVGHSPQEEAAERSAEYSVRVLFATPARALLGNVGLVVTDAQGRVVFRIEGADPIIYLGLPAGTYAFEGSYHGATQRHRRAVDRATRRDIVFVFAE